MKERDGGGRYAPCVPAAICCAWCFLTAAAEPGAPAGRATIRPSLVRLAPGETQAFKVVMLPRRLRVAQLAQDVAWAVNDIPGGNEALGTIDASGVYHAPQSVPTPCEVHICAKVAGAENASLWATVLIGDGEPSYKLLETWGEDPEESEHLKEPHGITLEADGNLLITDLKNHGVHRFTSNGEFLATIGAGNMESPRDVAVDQEGRVFISDVRTGPPRIQVFNAKDGALLFGFAEKGIGPGQVMRTQGMAFDPKQQLLVCDIDNMRVNVYDRDGGLLETWEKDGEHLGELNGPYGLAVDANGDVFVANYYGPCQKFTSAGDLLCAFAHANPPDGPIGFQNAATDRWGNVYLAARHEGISPGDLDEDQGKRVAILKYNNQGDLVTTIPLPPGELGDTGMVVDKTGRLYVAVNRGDRVGVDIYGQE